MKKRRLHLTAPVPRRAGWWSKEVKKMDNNKKPSEPLEPERWAKEEVDMIKNSLAVQILALSIQILALVVILLRK